MEQLLIVEDDIGLNQGLCKALKADARQIISCQDLKTAKEQLLCGGVSLILLYQSAGWQRARAAPGGQGKHTLYSCYSADCQRHRSGHRRRTGEGR